MQVYTRITTISFTFFTDPRTNAGTPARSNTRTSHINLNPVQILRNARRVDFRHGHINVFTGHQINTDSNHHELGDLPQ